MHNKVVFLLAAVILAVSLCAGKSLDPMTASCDSAKSYFESINVTSSSTTTTISTTTTTTTTTSTNQNGPVCNGHCCDSSTESILLQKSTSSFERIVKNHIKSHRSLWDSTADTFRDHILELMGQSENKTLNVFAKVYPRMAKYSRQLTLELYKSMRSHFLQTLSGYEDTLEQSIHHFFTRLFPMAYLHVIKTDADNSSLSSETDHVIDFNDDYKNCLIRSFDKFEPFSKVPQQVVKDLVQSISTAAMFLKGLQGGAEVLVSAEELNISQLHSNCKEALLKMGYCSSCRGYGPNQAKPCYGYCMNVMRGCVNLYMGSLNKDWNSFTETIPKLHSLVSSETSGIDTVIKGLESKLSDAIMHAIQIGPTIDTKIKHECGNPQKVTKDLEVNGGVRKQHDYHPSKWSSPPYIELLDFIASLDRSKDFFMRIADSLCEDEDYKQKNQNCWTGTHLGEYRQEIYDFDHQKYNPAVQQPQTEISENGQLHILSDKLIQLRYTVLKPLPSLSSSGPRFEAMQADMAEEASGEYYDNSDDEDYGYGSGDGSGDVPFQERTPTVSINSTPPEDPSSASTHLHSSTSAAILIASSIFVIVFRIQQ